MSELPPEFPPLDENSPPRWQFSLLWLFCVMTAAAAVAALVRFALDDPWIRFMLLAYAVVMGGYAMLRVPFIFSLSGEQRRIRKYREGLLQWAQRRREAKRREVSEREHTRNSQ